MDIKISAGEIQHNDTFIYTMVWSPVDIGDKKKEVRNQLEKISIVLTPV